MTSAGGISPWLYSGVGILSANVYLSVHYAYHNTWNLD